MTLIVHLPYSFPFNLFFADWRETSHSSYGIPIRLVEIPRNLKILEKYEHIEEFKLFGEMMNLNAILVEYLSNKSSSKNAIEKKTRQRKMG